MTATTSGRHIPPPRTRPSTAIIANDDADARHFISRHVRPISGRPLTLAGLNKKDDVPCAEAYIFAVRRFIYVVRWQENLVSSFYYQDAGWPRGDVAKGAGEREKKGTSIRSEA